MSQNRLWDRRPGIAPGRVSVNCKRHENKLPFRHNRRKVHRGRTGIPRSGHLFGTWPRHAPGWFTAGLRASGENSWKNSCNGGWRRLRKNTRPMRQTNIGTLNAALEYATQFGWPVIPCKRKTPLTRNGYRDATVEPSQIRQWWQRHPDANIGIPSGKRSGFDALDVDSKYYGDEALEELTSVNGRLPETPEAITGSGGRHILFRHEDGVTNSSGNLPKGLDVRGEGGYIIVAPSLHENGRQYNWEDSCRPENVALAPWPAWLLSILRPGNGKHVVEPVGGDIPEGQRNTTLTSLAGSMRRHDMGEEAIREALRVENRNRCKPPLPDSEVQSIARSSTRFRAAAKEGAQKQKIDPLSALCCVAEVESEVVHWLWEPRIPIGHLTGLEGDPGAGKSFLTQAIATGLSCGQGLPGSEAFPPVNTLLLTAEDHVPTTVRPRLEAMGANLARIFAHDDAFPLVGEGLEHLEMLVARTSARLVVVDPIVAYLLPETDMHRANAVRAILTGLASLAKRRNCAMVIVRHLAKGTASKAIYRGLGSIDFAAAYRSILLAGHDADDQEARGLVQIKNNLAPSAEAIGYRVEHGRFRWMGPTNITSDRILAPEAEASALGDARSYLLEVLQDGPKPVKEIMEEARAMGISAATLRRAREALNIKPDKTGFQKAWVWELPRDDQKML